MIFENTTEYDKAAIYALAGVQVKATRRLQIRRWVLLVAGVWLCLCGALLLLRLRWLDFSGHIVTGMTLVLGPFGLLQGLYFRRLMAWKTGRQILKGDSGPRRFLFSAEAFQAEQAGIRSIYRYEILQSAYEVPGYFILTLDNVHSMILSMGGFTQGTADGFRSFLEEKLGEPVQYLR